MKGKKKAGDICVDCIIYLFYGLFALLCIFPFYYIFINTVSANDLVAAGQITLLPRGIHFSNYVKVIQLRNLPNAVMVSLSRTILGTGLSVLCTAFVGYGVSRKELFRRKFVYRFFIVTMYFNAGLIPWYLNMRNLHLTNNFLAYIIGVISAFNLILVKTYVESIPDSLHESAEIDGAGYLVIFFRIMLPLCLPILATIATFTAVGHWNSFMDTLMLMRNEKLYTLQYILWQYLNEATAVARNIQAMMAQGISPVNTSTMLTPTAVKMTIAMVVTLPVLFVYPFFQKYFVRGIMIGAVKG
ncbi:MAG: carbohydrate ABC transporter permease [Treponema sp.]|jgi:putative aldouronate transport system permease protein|nr:carbohydrate ABC transporter permease [Treponema sp.]